MTNPAARFRRASRALALTLALVASAWTTSPAHAAGAPISATVQLGYTGSSSLHDWEGKAPPVSTTLQASTTPGAWDGEFTVPVASLDSGNGTRDGNMRAMFHADRHPDLRIALHGIDPAAVERDRAVKAALTIGDITRDIPVRIANWRQSPGHVSFDTDADVSLQDFGLEAPSVLGIVRVADLVKVTGHVELVLPEAGAPPAEGKPK